MFAIRQNMTCSVILSAQLHMDRTWCCGCPDPQISETQSCYLWGDHREVFGKYEFPSLLKYGHFLEIRRHKKANKKPVLVYTGCTDHCHFKPTVQEKGSIRCQGEGSHHHCFPKLLYELLPQRKRPLVLRKWQRFPTVLTVSAVWPMVQTA